MNKLEYFPESRYKHCYSVGKKMYWYAKIKLGWDNFKCQEMFVLGNLHDIGYELDGNSLRHNAILAETLKDSYKYWKEIYFHAYEYKDYDTVEMRLLYFADLTVDADGNWVTYEERLNDLIKRHGEDSNDVKIAKSLIKQLKELGFEDNDELEQYININIADYRLSIADSN